MLYLPLGFHKVCPEQTTAAYHGFQSSGAIMMVRILLGAVLASGSLGTTTLGEVSAYYRLKMGRPGKRQQRYLTRLVIMRRALPSVERTVFGVGPGMNVVSLILLPLPCVAASSSRR